MTATAPKPTEVFDHIATITTFTCGFAVDEQLPDNWVCIPWGHHEFTGYGSTVFLAIADAAHQLEHQEA